MGWQSQQNCAVMLTRENMVNLYNVLKGVHGDQMENLYEDESENNGKQSIEIDSKLERISIECPRIKEMSIEDVIEHFDDMYQGIGWTLESNKHGNPVLSVVKVK